MSGAEEDQNRYSQAAAVSVYVFADRDANRVKVGISSNPKKRLRSLCFPDLAIVGEIQLCSRELALHGEQELLKRFSKHRIGNSEWLRCSDDFNADNAAAVLNEHVARIGFAQIRTWALASCAGSQALWRYVAQ